MSASFYARSLLVQTGRNHPRKCFHSNGWQPPAGQTASPTDLQFHKFQPKVSPEQATSGAPSQGTLSNGISVTAAQQMLALQREKNSRYASATKN